MTLIFISEAWVDDPAFKDGDEVEFLNEVITHFNKNSVILDVWYRGPKVD